MQTLRDLGSRFLFLLALLALVPLATAKDQTPKPTDVPATVIAHLPLPQSTGSQMLLQKENGKNYLYVQQASKQGFMVVDVTKPDKPNLLKRTAESNQATAGNLEMVTPDVAISAADLILLRPDLTVVPDAIALARAARRTIRRNLAWAFGYNFAAVPLAAAGFLNPLIAAAAMTLSSVLVVTNSLRLRRFRVASAQ
jgi:hypothetical protein